jgi:hypothetical protein
MRIAFAFYTMQFKSYTFISSFVRNISINNICHYYILKTRSGQDYGDDGDMYKLYGKLLCISIFSRTKSKTLHFLTEKIVPLIWHKRVMLCCIKKNKETKIRKIFKKVLLKTMNKIYNFEPNFIIAKLMNELL